MKRRKLTRKLKVELAKLAAGPDPNPTDFAKPPALDAQKRPKDAR